MQSKREREKLSFWSTWTGKLSGGLAVLVHTCGESTTISNLLTSNHPEAAKIIGGLEMGFAIISSASFIAGQVSSNEYALKRLVKSGVALGAAVLATGFALAEDIVPESNAGTIVSAFGIAVFSGSLLLHLIGEVPPKNETAESDPLVRANTHA